MKLLVIEDEMSLQEIMAATLRKEGYVVETASTFAAASEKLGSYSYDCVLLDITLPDGNGLELLADIKKTGNSANVIITSARDSLDDKIRGLELGADDYMEKPFDTKELVARVKAVLRRYEPKQEEVDKNRLKFGGLEINLSNYSVSYNGKSLEFPPKEFELLSFLAQHPNRVFTREQLLDRIWGYEYVGDTRTVDVHVKRIREKLNSEDEWGILTVWSVGYKFGQK